MNGQTLKQNWMNELYNTILKSSEFFDCVIELIKNVHKCNNHKAL